MRIKEFDLAKGIACVFVVMGHTTITNVEWWNTICMFKKDGVSYT